MLAPPFFQLGPDQAVALIIDPGQFRQLGQFYRLPGSDTDRFVVQFKLAGIAVIHADKTQVQFLLVDGHRDGLAPIRGHRVTHRRMQSLKFFQQFGQRI